MEEVSSVKLQLKLQPESTTKRPGASGVGKRKAESKKQPEHRTTTLICSSFVAVHKTATYQSRCSVFWLFFGLRLLLPYARGSWPFRRRLRLKLQAASSIAPAPGVELAPARVLYAPHPVQEPGFPDDPVHWDLEAPPPSYDKAIAMPTAYPPPADLSTPPEYSPNPETGP